MKTNNSDKKSESKNAKAASAKADKSKSKVVDSVKPVEGEFLAAEGNGNKGHVVGNGGNGIA